MIEIDFEDMKNKIKKNPVTKKHLDKFVAVGYSEDEAVAFLLRVYCDDMGFDLKWFNFEPKN